MYQTEIDLACKYLSKKGGVISVPTDTTYGIICQLQDTQAVDRIYELKGRDRSKPLIILGSSLSGMYQWIDGSEELFTNLAEKFWPGALTIVTKAASAVPPGILSGGETVGIRIPAHPASMQVLSCLPDGCVASTSANLSGAGIPQSIDEVIKNIGDVIDYVMPDCGRQPDGSESTIVDISKDVPKILRAGLIPEVAIFEIIF